MAKYDVSQFLLDRANIQDVAAMMYFNFDLGRFDKLESDIFTDMLNLDYSSLFGTPPRSIERSSLLQEWKGLHTKVADSQHLITSIAPDLPQPGSATAPTTAKVTSNVEVLIKSFKNNLVENKGRMYLDVVKLEGVEGNPWRISGLKAEIFWLKGDFAQLGKDFAEKNESVL